MNMMQDVAYRYGLTKDMFNFEARNVQGAGTDMAAGPVLVSLLASGTGSNNAFFAGRADFCTMLLWRTLSYGNHFLYHGYDVSFVEHVDGSITNDTVVHELTHGITNRMTAGGKRRCLRDFESEGWGRVGPMLCPDPMLMPKWTESSSSTA
ncbi:hypothetical protein BDZ97DRAFT_1860287 [Flammula alnicola]|nr:hypothetical protein BDZ97DRAFT_1860287 [Flammula alnicola]